MGMKSGFAASEVNDHELVVIEKVEQTQTIVHRKVGGVQSMHIAHSALTIASARDSEDSGPLVPSQVEADPGERQQGQPDFTSV